MNVRHGTIWSLIVALLLVALAGSDCAADENFDSAFRSSRLPWYDSEADSKLKPLNPPAQDESAVADRNRIPPAQIKKKGQQVVKPKTAPTAPAATNNAMGTIGTTIIYIVGAVLAIILIALLVYGFLKLESGSSDEADEDSARKKRKIKDHIKHLPFEIEEQEGDFESFADKAYREGDYSKAVIYLFADLLVAMSDSGIVRLQRGKTNRQYLNEIWDHGEIRPYYRKVMTAFEDAFFGKHDIEQNRAQECFAERPAFDTAIEKIRQQKFAASQNLPPSPPTGVRMEAAT